MFVPKKLKYKKNALEPIISEKTVEFHYEKHHTGYANTLNNLTKDTEFENMDLEEIIKQTCGKSEKKAIFNNAAQIWNHDLFWESLAPQNLETKHPTQQTQNLITNAFGTIEKFEHILHETCLKQFGSGWGWVVFNKESKSLEITSTSNAETPLTNEKYITCITIDVWEHAYYLDYQNRRTDYLKDVIKNLLNYESLNNLKL